MTYTDSFNTRSLLVLTCISAVLLLSACGSPDKGYYNDNNRFVRTDTPHNMTKREHVAREVPDDNYRGNNSNRYVNDDDVYSHAGYYNRHGYNLEDRGMNGNIDVPAGMVPPRGMCRVWFANRVADEQPNPETCKGIKNRVPSGAFVVYGG